MDKLYPWASQPDLYMSEFQDNFKSGSIMFSKDMRVSLVQLLPKHVSQVWLLSSLLRRAAFKAAETFL